MGGRTVRLHTELGNDFLHIDFFGGGVFRYDGGCGGGGVSERRGYGVVGDLVHVVAHLAELHERVDENGEVAQRQNHAENQMGQVKPTVSRAVTMHTRRRG